ncbi:MAG: hypothetical protein O2779_04135 [Nanoarchaeota archaeon]|nr:hypothetical protein [Nanoarchaeota archaeon]
MDYLNKLAQQITIESGTVYIPDEVIKEAQEYMDNVNAQYGGGFGPAHYVRLIAHTVSTKNLTPDQMLNAALTVRLLQALGQPIQKHPTPQ